MRQVQENLERVRLMMTRRGRMTKRRRREKRRWSLPSPTWQWVWLDKGHMD